MDSPTVTSPAMTALGVILGSAAYMAPEQARGRPVDKRADIWAFGAVLFEMLTGRQPFPGDDASHVLARVIERNPEWTALPPGTPPLVVRLLRRCLEKDVRGRLRDIADAKADLDDGTQIEMAGAAPARVRPLRSTAAAWTLAAIATIASIWSFTRGVSPPPSDPLDDIAVTEVQNRGALAVAENGTIAYVPAASASGRLVLVDANGGVRSAGQGVGNLRHPRFSPDGNRFVMFVQSESGSDSNELWVYDLARRTRSRLPLSGTVSRPIWSPDRRTITFQNNGSLSTIPADDSGPANVLLPKRGDALYPLAWSRDGRTLVFSRPSAQTNRDVWVLPAGSTPTPFRATNRDERSAMLSPDGRWMVYAVLEAGREEEVYLQRYPGPGDRVAVSVGGGREPVWSPSGDEIFYRSIDGTRMIAVSVRTAPTLAIGQPRTLFKASSSSAPSGPTTM